MSRISWEPKLIIEDWSVDYRVLAILSFLRKLNNGLIGLKTVVFFKNIYNNNQSVSER